MITVNEDTTIIGVSELRTHIDQILEESKKHKIIIGRRNKPIAVIMDMEKYNKMEAVLELLEDFALGFLAKEREVHSKPSDYIDIQEALKKVKSRLK